jgi:ribose 5-phosphate isomerase B
VVGPLLAIEILDAFVDAEFQGGRHARRVAKVDALDGVPVDTAMGSGE